MIIGVAEQERAVAAGLDDLSTVSSLFARAAAYLSGPHDAPACEDVANLLGTLDYAADPGIPDVRANRIALLEAAAKFSRVFQLDAPDAPGLAFVGGEIHPGLIAPAHAKAASASVGGAELSLGAAFEACIGEGIEYLSQLEPSEELPVAMHAEAIVQAAHGQSRSYLESLLSKTRTAADAQLDCLTASSLSGDGALMLPIDLCLRRVPGRARLTPPFFLSTGCAAGRTRAAAVLHGLCELIERDAAALWWRGGRRGRPVTLETPALRGAATLLTELRQGVERRRSWLLDITADLGIPAVAAISAYADGKGFACGLGARTTLADAARGAIMELCQVELAHAVVAAKCIESGEERLNARDRDHITRATMIDAAACALLHPFGMPANPRECPSQEAEAQIHWLAERLDAAGIDVFVLDLTRPRFGVPVVRIVAPGLQIEPSQLESARLARAIADTGGGSPLTGGVPLF